MAYSALTNPSADPIEKIFFCNGILFAVTQNGTTFDDTVWASADGGATWSDCGDFSLFSSGYRVRSITYANGYYFIVRDGLAAYSASPTSGWALVNTTPLSDDAYSVAHFSSFYWIGCSTSGTVFKSSSPGSGYTSVSTSLGYGHEWLAVASGRLFTATPDYGGAGAGVCSTADGSTWSVEIGDSQNRRLVTDGTVLFASRTAGTNADTLKFVSTGSWTAESACPDVAYDSNLFIVGGDLVAWGYPPGTRDTSNGTTWTQGFNTPPAGTSVTCSTTDGVGTEFVVFYDSGSTYLYSYTPGGSGGSTSMAAWPTQLPAPRLAGYSLAPTSAVARTDMDGGPARQRRRFTAAPTDITLGFLMTRAQFAIFEAWFEHRISSGADWFDASIDNGQGYVAAELRFVEPWQAHPVGAGMFEVSCHWETRNRPVMSDEDLTAAGVA